MNTFIDKLSGFFIKSVNILFSRNPERTGLGIFLGYVFSFFFDLFTPLIKSYSIIDCNSSNLFGWIAFGVIVIHMPYLMSDLFNKSDMRDNVYDVVQLIQKSNLTDSNKRELYRKLVNNYFDHAILKKDIIRLDKDTLAELQ